MYEFAVDETNIYGDAARVESDTRTAFGVEGPESQMDPVFARFVLRMIAAMPQAEGYAAMVGIIARDNPAIALAALNELEELAKTNPNLLAR